MAQHAIGRIFAPPQITHGLRDEESEPRRGPTFVKVRCATVLTRVLGTSQCVQGCFCQTPALRAFQVRTESKPFAHPTNTPIKKIEGQAKLFLSMTLCQTFTRSLSKTLGRTGHLQRRRQWIPLQKIAAHETYILRTVFSSDAKVPPV